MNNPKLPTPHTPGPWQDVITPTGMLIVDLRPQAKGVADILEIGDLEDTEAEDHANAKLMALAPELLDALVNLLDGYHAAIFAGRIGDDSTLWKLREEARTVLGKYYGPLTLDELGRLIPFR